MSSLKVWVTKTFWELFSQRVSWREVIGVLSLGVVGRLLWDQYGVLRLSNLPPHDLGLPIVGHTFTVLRESLESAVYRLMKGKRTLLFNFIGSNVFIVDWPLYLEHLHRLEVDGAMEPDMPLTLKRLLGPNSIISLPGGKGHALHKRLRNKLLACLGPKPVLGLLPEIIDCVRRVLDTMAAETKSQGFTSFKQYSLALAAEISTLPISAGLDAEKQKEVGALLDEITDAVLSMPINLGRFTSCGRGVLAKRRLAEIIKDLMESPNLSRRNIINDLVQVSEHGEGFKTDEMVDTVATLLLAGKLTTAEATVSLVAHLHEHRDWVQRIAKEPLSFQGCEDDSATMRFIREVMRVQPVAGAYRRSLIDKTQAIDLGEHGTIPPGMTIAVYLRGELVDLSSEFDPERWTPELAREKFIVFGGHQPHQCIGRNLALMELQVFARVLCAEYEFEALDTTMEVQAPFLVEGYKDGLKMKVVRKGA